MTQDPLSTRFSRRAAVAASLAAAVSVSAIRTSLAQEPSPAASPASGEWSFTDDKGVTVTLPSRPENLVIDVNAAAPLWDFGIRPTALFGWNVNEGGNLGDAGGNIDPEGITLVGDVNEPIKLEDTIAVNPDLIITLTWTPDDPQDYWSIDPALLEQVQQVAPLLAISATGNADVNTERFAELAGALGADLESAELANAKAAYEEAKSAFDTVIGENPDLTSLFMYVDDATAYAANPGDWGDLNMYMEHGMQIVEPEAEPGSYWEELSLEQALKYPADLFFASTRLGAFSPDDLKEHPTFGQHPAIKAGQVYPWNQDFIQSYQGMTEAVDAVRSALASSTKVTG